jgi:hypothetical protein
MADLGVVYYVIGAICGLCIICKYIHRLSTYVFMNVPVVLSLDHETNGQDG